MNQLHLQNSVAYRTSLFVAIIPRDASRCEKVEACSRV
jgi:hypothetical protein